MNSKLLICHLLLIFVFCVKYSHLSSIKDYSTTPKEYPFLTLIEVKLSDKDVRYANGVLVSLNWVMTVCRFLAKEPRGEPRFNITVFASLGSHEDATAGKAPRRAVVRLETDLQNELDNSYFPNLVLAKLDSAFPSSNSLKPAVINVGNLGYDSHMVGFAFDHLNGQPIQKPLSFPVKTLSSTQCHALFAVEFQEQFCTMLKDPVEGTRTTYFYDGALLVEKNCVTGLMQFTSNLDLLSGTMPMMVMVRLLYYQPFWEFNAHAASKFLETDFRDDLELIPWNPGTQRVKGRGVCLSHPWSLVLTTSLLSLLRR